ncbi:MAG: glycosyltransferase [Gemmataceae bacterium]
MSTLPQPTYSLSTGTPPWRKSTPHLFVVLPAYNEEENLGTLLEQVDQSMFDDRQAFDVIVVDDGSQDKTYEIACDYSKHMPVRVEQHKVNQGLGQTICDGLRKASSLCQDHDVVVALDADNSHTPALIPRMVSKIQEGNDVVIASRYRVGSCIRGVPWYRNWMSYGARYLCQSIYPIPGVRDYTCGFRAYRGSLLKRAFDFYGDNGFATERGFQCMLDILIKLHRLNAICCEVPMVLRYDLKGGASKMRVASTVRKTVSLLLRRRLGR